MSLDIWDFLTLVILVFGIVMAITGVFSVGFGAGKSKKYGAVLLVVGAIIAVVWIYLAGFSDIEPFCDVGLSTLLVDAVMYLIAILIGAIAAAGIFLVMVLKT